MTKKQLIVIGVTGGAGSGKSLLTQWFGSWGASVLDVDLFAKKIMTDSVYIKEELVKSFGGNSLRCNGTLNNHYLADIVFHDYDKLEKLNSIVWPTLVSSISNKIDNIRTSQCGLYVLDMAVLFEAKADSLCDHTVMVYAPKQDRIKRLIETRGWTPDQSRSRIFCQAKYTNTITPDTVICNGGSVKEFMVKAQKLFAELSKIIN